MQSASAVTTFGFGLTRVERVVAGDGFKTRRAPFVEFSLNILDDLPERLTINGAVDYQPYNLVQSKSSGAYAVYVSKWNQTNLPEVRTGPVIASPSTFSRGSNLTLAGVPYYSSTVGSVSFIRNTDPTNVEVQTLSDSAYITVLDNEFRLDPATQEKRSFDHEISTPDGQGTQSVRVKLEARYLPEVDMVGHESGVLLPKNAQTKRLVNYIQEQSASTPQRSSNERFDQMSASEYANHGAYVIDGGTNE